MCVHGNYRNCLTTPYKLFFNMDKEKNAENQVYFQLKIYLFAVVVVAAVILISVFDPYILFPYAKPMTHEMKEDLSLHEIAIQQYTDRILQTNAEIVKIQKQLRLLDNTYHEAASLVNRALLKQVGLLESQLFEFTSNQSYWSDQRDGLVSLVTCLELMEYLQPCFLAYNITMLQAESTNMHVCIEVSYLNGFGDRYFTTRCVYYVYLQESKSHPQKQ